MNYYNNTKKYYINLDEKKERAELITRQVGKDFIRWSACVGKELTLFQISSLFDPQTSFKKYKCYLTTGEMACTLSHFSIYQDIVQDDSINEQDYVLISEDDNQFTSQFKQKLDQLIHYLQNNRFENNEIVLLRYNSINAEDHINYGKILSYLKTNKVTPKSRNKLLQAGFREDEINTFDKYCIRESMRVHKSSIYSFNYNLVNDNSEQSLVAVHKFLPRSSACYLIRKHTCRRIINKYKKPWWITDDFKSIIPISNILVATPFLAYDSDYANESSIYNHGTIINYDCSRIVGFKEKYIFKVLKYFKFILSWNYSTNKYKRKFATLISKILFLA